MPQLQPIGVARRVHTRRVEIRKKLVARSVRFIIYPYSSWTRSRRQPILFLRSKLQSCVRADTHCFVFRSNFRGPPGTVVKTPVKVFNFSKQSKVSRKYSYSLKSYFDIMSLKTIKLLKCKSNVGIYYYRSSLAY